MKVTLGKKLGFGFGSILSVILIGGTASLLKVSALRQEQTLLLNTRIPALNAGHSLQRDVFEAEDKCRQTLLAGNHSGRKKESLTDFQKAWEQAEQDLSALTELSFQWSDQNRARLASAKASAVTFRELQQNAIDISGQTTGGLEKAENYYAETAAPVEAQMTKTMGDLLAAFETLNYGTGNDLATTSQSLVRLLSVTTMASLGMGILVAFFLGRRISASTRAVLEQAEAITQGDLTRDDLAAHGQDELAELGQAINKMSGGLKKMIRSIVESAQQVANASAELSTTSQKIVANSEETSAQANVVSHATQQVSQNLQSVATGAEQMTSTIQSIANNTHEAATMASKAVRSAQAANATVGKLGESSAEIGEVIKVITSIAQQTNLLALNATIEAARAGEAGKGFAVVANEVKELAKQTAKATDDISRKIAAIQHDTKGAVEAISSISGVINEVSDISGTIATAVEQQSATTNEMTRNVADAAHGSEEITHNIAGVAQAAQDTSTSAHDSQKAANELAEMAAQLRSVVSQFKIEDHCHAGSRTQDQLALVLAARAGK